MNCCEFRWGSLFNRLIKANGGLSMLCVLNEKDRAIVLNNTIYLYRRLFRIIGELKI
jgi:hypothetical protein